jgi:hypothetical protein
MENKFKKLSLVSLILIFLGIIFWHNNNYFYFYQNGKNLFLSLYNRAVGKKNITLNIFVHGTVGSTLALFDTTAVKSDSIKNTTYKKTNKIMRNTKLFQKDGIMLDRGLIQIEPTFFSKEEACAFAIIESFKVIDSLVNSPWESNLYYTFGWNGLMSQAKRKIESIRLYNSLSEEIKKLKNKGFYPKIRILAHSHGGNLSLNLAGAFHYIKQKNKDSDDFYKDLYFGSYIKEKFSNLIEKLPSQEISQLKQGYKKFSYAPENINLQVDELLIFGTPIQAETELFFTSPFFKKIYSVYSQEDGIQAVDTLTTADGSSRKKIKPEILQKSLGKTTQAQIKTSMHTNQKEEPTDKTQGSVSSQPPTQQTDATPWWQVVLGIKTPERKSSDPTHKELWFLVPFKQGTTTCFIRPVPIVSFSPILLALSENTGWSDIIFQISKTNEKAIFSIQPNDMSTKQKTLIIPVMKIEELRESLKPWELSKRDLIKIKEATEGCLT